MAKKVYIVKHCLTQGIYEAVVWPYEDNDQYYYMQDGCRFPPRLKEGVDFACTIQQAIDLATARADKELKRLKARAEKITPLSYAPKWRDSPYKR